MEDKKCVKCDLQAGYTGVDPKKAWYCRECFIQMVRNKFRSTLSKRKIFKDAESRETLVIFDGSPSSVFLLNQIDDALRQVNFKRLMIQPTMVVLVSVTDPAQIQQVIERMSKIRSLLFDNIRWIICHVACCMENSLKLDFGSSIDQCFGTDKISDYLRLIDSCSNETYRNEMKRILREKCLRNISKWCGIGKVMVSDTADELGRLTLDQLCLGRGGSLSSLVSVVDKRDGFTIIRPIRDISKKEIGIVNYLCKYDEYAIQILDNVRNTKNSIQKLTNEFVETLENENFCSTINTVLSTASKIHASDEGKQTERCRFCEIEPVEASCISCSTCSLIVHHSDSQLLNELFL